MSRSLVIWSLLLVVLLAMGVSTAKSQELQITLALSPHPSMKLSDWQSKRETATLVVTNTSSKTRSANISAKLSLNGSVIVATKPDAMPVLSVLPGQSTYFGGDIFPQNAISLSGDARDVSRSGNLPEGAYEICITIESSDSHDVLSNHECKNFFLTKYSLPVLLQPNNGTSVVVGLEPTIFFSWSPLVPSPSNLVYYRVRLTELVSSQNPKQALLTNRPVFEKTVTSITQLPWPQELKLPSTGGSYVWSVQAEDADGTALVMPERFAEPFVLTVLPSQEECLKLLAQAQSDREELLAEEERYWRDYAALQELRKEYESATDRVDVYELERIESEVKTMEATVEREQQLHEVARKKFDDAMQRYKQCLGH